MDEGIINGFQRLEELVLALGNAAGFARRKLAARLGDALVEAKFAHALRQAGSSAGRERAAKM